jgi:Type II secretory pathway, component PulD
MKKFLALLVSVVMFSQVAFAAIESRGLISVDFQNTTLYTVLNILSMKTGRKFVTDADLLNKKIVLSLKDVTPDEALNALLDTYDLYYVKQGDTNIYVIKSKSDVSPITVSKVIFCNYAKSTDLEKVLLARLSKGGRIASDERTNSVIITDLADSIDKMENLIRSLDVPTPQVLIESKIVDVNLSNQLMLGTQIDDIYRMPKASSYFDPISNKNKWRVDPNGYAWVDPWSVMKQDDPPAGKNSTEYSQVLSVPTSVGVGRFSAAVMSGDWNIIGNFFAGVEDKNAKILTNPKLIVLNNQEATIDIVEEVPYQSDKTTSAESGAITATTAFKQVGLKMKVKPQINRDGTIVLQVEPEQSFRTGESLDGIPVINTSRAKTVMMLRSGETAVIGGLIRETETKTENKVPLLGDIPILGYLFKSIVKNKARHELTIFISAKIIN